MYSRAVASLSTDQVRKAQGMAMSDLSSGAVTDTRRASRPKLEPLIPEPSLQPNLRAAPDIVCAYGSTEGLFLTTRRQLHLAYATVVVFGLLTLCLLPWSAVRGPILPGFVPAYQMAVCLFYAISSLLVLNHFRRTRVIALLHIASGSVFSACILLAQMFSFRIWGDAQIFGSTPDTTSWLWTFWHLGPPALTLSYVFALRCGAAQLATSAQSARRLMAVAIVFGIALAGMGAAASTWGVPWLPKIVEGDDYRALLTSGVGPGVQLFTIVALAILVARTHCATAVELSLALALALLAADNILTLSGGYRNSLGWYFGRAEAAASAAVLLGFYLTEIDRRFVEVSTRAETLAAHETQLREEISHQQEANASLSLLARQDGLTRLANRRRFDEQLETEWLRTRREHRSLTLLMIDVDHFKTYNDRYGHQMGDECLREIAWLLREVARRPGDLPARYGGEEFIIMLPNTGLEGGAVAAEALLSMLAWRAIQHSGSPNGFVTVSIGVASYRPGDLDATAEAVVARADKALYAAKKQGRNRLELSLSR